LWCKTPLLDVGFDENKSHLAEIDVYLARSIGADCGKEVLCLEAVRDVIELLAVACEEERAGARAVTDANDVSLNVGWTVSCGYERLVVSSVAVGHV
tara:strand:- start:3159 stop:3449 length:291 start_codon:yes stop_codon:yes gene_type:complete